MSDSAIAQWRDDPETMLAARAKTAETNRIKPLNWQKAGFECTGPGKADGICGRRYSRFDQVLSHHRRDHPSDVREQEWEGGRKGANKLRVRLEQEGAGKKPARSPQEMRRLWSLMTGKELPE